ncbi:Mor transcription activator family protein [Thaumasiovibrio subtropicus]|uniref:Mor transcription activator family protein n=1 Tax=Thaumasiovibrio subtropicus TaxID=1891207 RepID=UPI000B35AA4C|nr:Mor transcription activator family protein [Thaumasiovibrio subtropicus]
MTQQVLQQEIFTESTSELHDLLDHLEHIAPDALQHRWPSSLQSIAELFRFELERSGVTDPHIANKLVLSLGHYLGGRDIYIPNGNILKTAVRNIQIWRDFNGRNIEALAVQYQLSERQITSILKEQRTAEVKRRQRALF